MLLIYTKYRFCMELMFLQYTICNNLNPMSCSTENDHSVTVTPVSTIVIFNLRRHSISLRFQSITSFEGDMKDLEPVSMEFCLMI